MTKELRKEYELVREKYNEFMEEAVELYHELNGGSFEIYKPFNEWAYKIGLDVDNNYGELEQRFSPMWTISFMKLSMKLINVDSNYVTWEIDGGS